MCIPVSARISGALDFVCRQSARPPEGRKGRGYKRGGRRRREGQRKRGRGGSKARDGEWGRRVQKGRERGDEGEEREDGNSRLICVLTCDKDMGT